MGPMGKLYNYVIYIHSLANYIKWFIKRAGKIVPLNNYIRQNSWFLILYIALKDKIKAEL